MKRSTWVWLAIAVWIVAEIAVLAQVAKLIGIGTLLLVLVAEAVLGGWLLRRQGSKAWASVREAQAEPAKMGSALTDAALVFLGAMMLMVPGFLSDLVALTFLIPATRGLARRAVSAVLLILTARQRAQADLLIAQWDRSSVVEGETVVEPSGWRRYPHADHQSRTDPVVIRGEVEPGSR